MRKFLWFIVVILIATVGALVAAPSFIDWNQYKGMASDKVRELTGRELAIAGKVHIAIWPAPALVAEDVTFSNAPGAQSPTMASLKAVEARVALAPLFGGKIKVETVKLIEPVIELERMADGRANWEFATPAKPAELERQSAAGSRAPSSGEGTPDVILDNFTIENGTIVYRDARSGLIEPVEKLNATVAAASLQGPLESTGSMVLRNIPLSYSASLGEIIHGRTVPVNARVSLSAGDLSVRVGGSLVNLLEAPEFKGTAKIEGEDLAASLAALDIQMPAAGAPLALSLGGQMTASASALEIKDLSLAFAGIQAKGDFQADLTQAPRFGSRLAINRIDVDKLAAHFKKPEAVPGTTSSKPKAAEPKAAKPKSEQAQTPVRFSLPDAIAGSLILTIDAIGYKDGVVRDVLLNAELADGTLRLGQLSAQFPGGSDLSLLGQLQTPEGVPTFTGEVESTVNDLRGVMSWLSIAPPPVPADRLRKLAVKTQISATPEQLQIAGLDMRFDSSHLQGGVTVALRKRLGLGAALVLDRINVDAYLPPPELPKPGAPASSPSAGQPVKLQKSSKQANPFSALAALSTFDANFNVHVKSAVYKRTPLKDLVAEGTLYNGALDLKRLSVGKLAGASANISGKLAGLNAVPEAKALRFSAKVPDLAALARIADTKLPLDAKKLGAVSLKGRVDGSLLAPTIDAITGIAGATAAYKGRVSPLSASDLLSGRLTVKHNDLPKLLRRLGIDYQPAGKLGALDLSSEIKGGAEKISLTNLKGAIGKTALAGTLGAILSGPKPVVSANLQTGALNIEHFLPAQKRASLRGLVPTLVPASWRVPANDVAGLAPSIQLTARGQWPTTPLDLSALNALDADIELRAPVLIYGRYLAENADIAATLKNGVLTANRLAAKLFGGTLSGQAQAAAAGNRIRSALKVTGLNVEEALKAVTGEAAANGRMDVNFDVGSGGKSVAAIIAGLAGNANFAISDMDVRKASQGSLMSGLLGLFTSLNQLGGKATNDKAAVSASFNIARGIATTRNLKLASAFGNGGAAGSIDLPRWQIDLKGEIALAESMLMRILKAKVRETNNSVPFAITGSLEAPNVKVDTGSMLGAGVPIPGADALLNKAPKGVGTILKGILGGGLGGQQQQSPPPPTGGSQPPPPGSTPPPPPSDTQQQPQQLTPDKLLKQLFKL